MFLIGSLRPSIATKAMLLILLLAGMSGLANWFCLRVAGRLDQVSHTTAAQVSPALLALAEAKTAVSSMGLATYKTVAAAEREAAREAGSEIATQFALAKNSLNNFVGHFPTHAADARLIGDKLAKAHALAGSIRDDVHAGRSGEAQRTIGLLFEPALDDVTFQTNRLINIIHGDVKTRLAAGQDEANWLFYLALAILAGGTLLTTGLAAAMAQLLIARPLKSLAAHTVRVRTEGATPLAPDDAMLRRPDEIGTLARSFNGTIFELNGARHELAAHLQRLDAAINNMPQGVCMFDADQRLIVCNRRYAAIYGLPAEEMMPGMTLREILERRVASGTIIDDSGYIESQLTAVADNQPHFHIRELRDGRVLAVSQQPTLDGGWVAVHEDITERRRSEARIAYLAQHDALTDLPNRNSFRSEMEKARPRIDRGECLAVLCLDLDHFKTINDTLGHPVGDELLQAVAGRLRHEIRETDTVARFGGDEFVILQTSVEQPSGATALATRLIEAISQPFDVGGHRVVVSASIGVAIGPNDGRDPDVLIKNADLALYRAKEEGRATHRFFEPEMDARMQARRTMEIELRKALQLGEFEVFYQPLMNLATNEISAFEALLRWRHPERGLVAPAEFIPLAEEIGLIVPIGAWVLRQACLDAVRWPEPIKVAVNLSPRQFAGKTVALDVVSALGASGLAPSRLEVEITETVLLQDTDSTLLVLNQLRALGVHISMDDFGTGYSSLGYLKKFPFDKIKIDRSFIQDLGERPESITIVRAIAGLGSALGITTTAEGVENAEQLEKLRAEGCTEVQGFLLGKPRPVSEFGDIFVQGMQRERSTV